MSQFPNDFGSNILSCRSTASSLCNERFKTMRFASAEARDKMLIACIDKESADCVSKLTTNNNKGGDNNNNQKLIIGGIILLVIGYLIFKN